MVIGTMTLDTVDVKAKLDDIEAQLDRILDKQKQLAIDYIKLDYNRELRAIGLI